MEPILQSYLTLLEVYTEQVKVLENRKKEVQKKHPHISAVPHKALNSRMFNYDENLTNVHHNSFCYKEKNQIMPHLVTFLATYEKSSDEEKKEFENSKPKNEYQEYLDEVYLDKIPFIPFLESQLDELYNRQSQLSYPHRPKQRNAIRQHEQYKEDLKKYEEKIESINRCRNEVNERIQLFNELLKKQ